MTPCAHHDPIHPSHPVIGEQRSPEYLKGFDEGKQAAVAAFGYSPKLCVCEYCDLCEARVAAFFLLVDKFYAVYPHLTIEEIRDRNKRVILQVAMKEE